MQQYISCNKLFNVALLVSSTHVTYEEMQLVAWSVKTGEFSSASKQMYKTLNLFNDTDSSPHIMYCMMRWGIPVNGRQGVCIVPQLRICGSFTFMPSIHHYEMVLRHKTKT
jgi:hypothetical protein